MQIIIAAQNEDGTFPVVGTNNRVLMQHIPTESCAIRQAIHFARGRGYRLEMYSDANPYSDPIKVIVQNALPFAKDLS
jgi:hypothetical protein